MLSVALGACGLPEGDDVGATHQALKAAHAPRHVSKGKVARGQVRVAASMQPRTYQDDFVINETNTVFFVAAPAAPSGQHQLTFEVFEPGGGLYQSQTVAFTGSAKRIPVELVSSMPVAGTWVQQFSMTGDWVVKAWLDDAADPIDEASFTLE